MSAATGAHASATTVAGVTTLRPFVPSDLPGLYNICLRTGDSGADASALYHDPFLLGHVYAGPYPLADAGLTFVLVGADGLLGYIVATADTLRFEEWLERSWWPTLREQLAGHPGTDPGDGSQDWERVQHIASTRPHDDELFRRFPAHLHIDLLPQAQGGGNGRRLMDVLLHALRERGVPGVHLGVGAGNPRARAFYLALGFTEERVHDWGSTMVRDLTTGA
ncbi:Acetyltransferase (GNAT) family protein [Sanguibacter gelidistatuariae]|uniref:Acetyltransferase (GNAT) family protein n=1 Tax=Sanguibacter gelidistatuariae TaxID=1814289 RepID=A0A1G6MU15_9MICO|nr:Acetyltransferase (GNAT) family protein [Sanguibacter gelidistatuariae]